MSRRFRHADISCMGVNDAMNIPHSTRTEQQENLDIGRNENGRPACLAKGRPPPGGEEAHGKKVKTNTDTANAVAVAGESSEMADQQVGITSHQALTVSEIRELTTEQSIKTDVIEQCMERARAYREQFGKTTNKGERMLATVEFMNDIKSLDETY
ncbi:hypothetical protein AbraIFM66951_011894 [Aspergillus brasiliensis]|nr:hypothetical protein AbraIFM66951_011894 [Aspergillus brasiliensis]